MQPHNQGRIDLVESSAKLIRDDYCWMMVQSLSFTPKVGGKNEKQGPCSVCVSGDRPWFTNV